MLGRIRASLADRPPVPGVPRGYRTSSPPDVDPVALFSERVRDYRATVHRRAPADVGATIATALATRGARRVGIPPGFDRALIARAAVEVVVDEPPLARAELDALDGVVTACAVAIAETGTIVIDAGPDQGRRALSLLPDYHLCVVGADQIVGTVAEALARLDPRRPLTWISGPSATSDIELQRVEGVHGPRTFDVVIVEALSPALPDPPAPQEAVP
ncbi:MAG: lactate utilization protein C [Anaerolinea sp.]|nr:lactate utilization protein C [Anaerolinea sp.]